MHVCPDLLDYLEALIIGQGREAGQRLQLYPWQRRFLRCAFGQPDDAALSLARGGGKTTFTAGIAAATVGEGPLVEPMAETLVVASSFDQGLVCFRHILHFLQPAIEADSKRWRIQDSANRATVQDRETGAMMRVLGSDPRRLHGATPKLIMADEVAQWPENLIDRMLAALETSRGKIPDSKMLWLGTRASSPDHPFEAAFKLVGYAQVHAARKTDPVFQHRTWKRANPGLNRQPDLERAIRQEAKRARKDPSALARFKALRLNLGVSDTVESTLLDADVWERIETEAPETAGPFVLGLDLGQNAAMSAAAAYFLEGGGLEAFAVFPEYPDLLERGRQYGVVRLYLECFDRAELLTEGQRVSDVGALLAEVRQRWGNPAAIVCDRSRESELRQALEAVSFPTCPLIVRGMGYMDGGADVREFRKACIDERVRPRRSRCRDDAAAAAILAVAEGRRRAAQAQSRPAFQYAIV